LGCIYLTSTVLLHQVNAILSRAANNVLVGDVRRRLLLEMVSECPGHGASVAKGMLPQAPEKQTQHNPQTGVVSTPVGRQRAGGGEGVHDSLIAHRQRLAGALEAAVAGAGAAGNGRVH
jgi:hypothetical protein